MIPGSHRWGDDRIPAPDDPTVVPMVMSAGSVAVMFGTTWHRSGASRSAPRIGINAEYCEPYLRQIENMSLLMPPDKARAYGPRVQQLLGYDLHSGFIGYVDGLHPLRLLDPDYGKQGRSEAGKAAADLLTRPGSWHMSGRYEP
jgi:ectoine hydroxylase-related dioxygenase (phytanoyl-CoA dioxygenase family)